MKDKLLEFIRSASGDSAAELSTPFSTLGLDSLEFLQLVKDVEQDFNVSISDVAIAHISCGYDLLAVVESCQ